MKVFIYTDLFYKNISAVLLKDISQDEYVCLFILACSTAISVTNDRTRLTISGSSQVALLEGSGTAKGFW